MGSKTEEAFRRKSQWAYKHSNINNTKWNTQEKKE